MIVPKVAVGYNLAEYAKARNDGIVEVEAMEQVDDEPVGMVSWIEWPPKLIASYPYAYWGNVVSQVVCSPRGTIVDISHVARDGFRRCRVTSCSIRLVHEVSLVSATESQARHNVTATRQHRRIDLSSLIRISFALKRLPESPKVYSERKFRKRPPVFLSRFSVSFKLPKISSHRIRRATGLQEESLCVLISAWNERFD